MHHSPLRTVALVAAVALTFVACGDDGGTGSTATTTTATATGSGAGSDSSAAGTLIDITYKAGKVDGGGRRQVAKGQTVTLQVTSDIVDEVHLHGYDKAVDTIANQPVQIVFKAVASGVFEVELEKKGLKLVDIEVK